MIENVKLSNVLSFIRKGSEFLQVAGKGLIEDNLSDKFRRMNLGSGVARKKEDEMDMGEL